MSEKRSEKYCRNCHFPMRDSDEFCSKCGQEYTTGRYKLRHIINDFFTQVFWFDSKLYRTIPPLLFRPGFLTNAYFGGQHVRFFAPLRMFFFLSIIHFGLIAYVVSQNPDGNSFNFGPNFGKDLKSKIELQKEIDSSLVQIKNQYPNEDVHIALDSLREDLNFISDDDSITVSNGSLLSIENGNRISVKEMQTMTAKELMDKYEVRGFVNRLVYRQTIKFFKSNEGYGQFFLKRLSWFSLLMIPIFAIILKCLYVRRKRYLVEHFVFALHYHSFAFILISIIILFRSYIPLDIVPPIAFFVLVAYLYIAMLRFYKQGKLKTFIKFMGLNFAYLVGFLVAFVIFAILSFMLF